MADSKISTTEAMKTLLERQKQNEEFNKKLKAEQEKQDTVEGTEPVKAATEEKKEEGEVKETGEFGENLDPTMPEFRKGVQTYAKNPLPGTERIIKVDGKDVKIGMYRTYTKDGNLETVEREIITATKLTKEGMKIISEINQNVSENIKNTLATIKQNKINTIKLQAYLREYSRYVAPVTAANICVDLVNKKQETKTNNGTTAQISITPLLSN